MSNAFAVTNETAHKAFWDRVDRSSADGCWPWASHADQQGRGRWRLNGRSMISSRAALLIAKGPPEGADLEDMQACHTCDNPACCRPDHLFWGTQSENMRDMGRKGRAGIQRHPERYQRPRRPDVRYRPVKQRGAPKGIDPRTLTRLPTPHELALAGRALEELDQNQNRIGLVPAPDPHFDSHKIRVIESRNPKWYIAFGAKYWRGNRQFDLKRARVEKALRRVLGGRVRGNGYEREILTFLEGFWPEMTA